MDGESVLQCNLLLTCSRLRWRGSAPSAQCHHRRPADSCEARGRRMRDKLKRRSSRDVRKDSLCYLMVN